MSALPGLRTPRSGLPRPGPETLSTLARLLAGGVFAASGWTKVVDVEATVRSVRAYDLLPESLVRVTGTGLPVLELGLAALLLTGLATRLAAGVTALLGLVFLAGVSSAWARGLSIECGCFGNSGFTSNPVPGYVREIVLNTVLIGVAAWLLRHPASRFSLDGALRLTPTPQSSATERVSP
jgi:uncharacterized membrane protein YphA (DoxX/SURF4 family)